MTFDLQSSSERVLSTLLRAPTCTLRTDSRRALREHVVEWLYARLLRHVSSAGSTRCLAPTGPKSDRLRRPHAAQLAEALVALRDDVQSQWLAGAVYAIAATPATAGMRFFHAYERAFDRRARAALSVNLGDACEQRGRLAEAQDWYINATRFDPEIAPVAHVFAMLTALRRGDVGAAHVSVEALASADQRGALACASIAALHRRRGGLAADWNVETCRWLRDRGAHGRVLATSLDVTGGGR